MHIYDDYLIETVDNLKSRIRKSLLMWLLFVNAIINGVFVYIKGKADSNLHIIKINKTQFKIKQPKANRFINGDVRNIRDRCA